MADGPNIGLIVPRSDEITSFYQAADRMGFHSLWFTEMVFSHGWGDGKGRDSICALSAAAAVTSRMRLGASPLGESA